LPYDKDLPVTPSCLGTTNARGGETVNSAATIFLAAFVALSASWAGFVLAPQLQLGREDQAKTLTANDPYPIARPGLARQGAEVYRALGCVYCHSQQVRQDGVKCEVILTDAGTNAAVTLAALGKLNREFGNPQTLAALPNALMRVADVPAAGPILKAIAGAGGKAEARVTAVGPDIARGWGMRRSVALDYVYDSPVQPGTRRFGPDLANVGQIRPDVNWQLRHLYAPKSEIQSSTMPPYRFLVEERRRGPAPSPDALQLTGDYAAPKDKEIVPTDDARALAAYLVSLRLDAPLFEGPFTAPVAPAAASATNAAPK
jgi:cbb3-type cytochrome oxidase cytochrome c subunit